ncbi:caveolae-associated protein 1b [Neoarius graeffei]|uniref:caveolae-associated protein 1b n=1 Tax=Neoarius graeffei TaxID=443677 RepID=UPI00298C9F1D|nr:caveolae-associated protein 1b [Neoarius graeffei]
MEVLEVPSFQPDIEQHKTLTEVSDDELNLPPSDDEEEATTEAKLKEVMEKEEEEEGDKGNGQMNGVMILALLDKIIGRVDQIQQTQAGLETRQQEMERSVTGIEGELTKLTKSHTTTANSVNKMLEKVRKVSVNVKTVRSNLEKQGGQIKRLESNENELLKRRNFKVMIYQDEVKLPSKTTVAKSLKVPHLAEGEGELEHKAAMEEGEEAGAEKTHIDLSSDEEEVEIEETIEETRAERIKRSSLQRVQNIKTVFSKEKMEKTKQKTMENFEKTKQKTKDNLEKTRVKTRENLERTKQKTKDNLEKTRHNIEKKMGKLGTRMSVNPERKEKLKTSQKKMVKSFTPDHTIYARSKTAVYKVPPFTFHVKKIREGEVEIQGTEMVEVGGETQEVENGVMEGGEEEEMEMEGVMEESTEMLETEDSELVLAEQDHDSD